MDLLGLLVPFLLSGAGVTAVVTISSGVMKWRSERQPRQRVAAIRAAGETLALLPVGTAAHDAVQAHVDAEAAALTASLQPKYTRRWWRLSRLLWPALAVVVTGIALVFSITADIHSAPEPRPDRTLPWPDLLAALSGAGAATIGAVLGLLQTRRRLLDHVKRKRKKPRS